MVENESMEITITIPKKMLSNRYATRQLILVESQELSKEARRRWEIEDTREAIKIARQEKKQGRLKAVRDLKEIMR